VESGSPCIGESQRGQVSLHRTRQGQMPPGQIVARWFQVTFPGNPYRKNLDGYIPSHTKGCEGNLLTGAQIQSLRMSGPLDGALGVPAAGHPLCHFVPRSVCSRRC
jgi:hypothetical protein